MTAAARRSAHAVAVLRKRGDTAIADAIVDYCDRLTTEAARWRNRARELEKQVAELEAELDELDAPPVTDHAAAQAEFASMFSHPIGNP